MKKLALLLVTAVLVAVSLGVSVQTVKADDPIPPKGPNCYVGLEGFVFTPYDGCVNYILGTGGWGATTRGLIVAFKTAAQNSLTISGSNGYYLAYAPETANLYWTPPIELGYPLEGCPQQSGWATWWLVPLGTNLAPGTYTIATTWTLSHPVTDGFTACNSGAPIGQNIYSGTWDQWSVDFTVMP